MQLFAFILNLVLFLTVSFWANAYNPLSVPNNKAGIHILFPSELEQAAKIVNHDQQAAWGYVTIPMQATDRHRGLWQDFFDRCKEQKIIPIIRVATVPEGSNWARPNSFDLIDFANFLSELHWPVQNRYVIIFNEVNRSDEYGGFVSPEEYAQILANASDIFKARSTDFFILPAGLDNAAANTKTSMNHRRYIERMYLSRPDIFDKIDGWTSHAYPNPAFSADPHQSGTNKIDSFRSDLRLIHQFTTKDLPIFITETGWSDKSLSDQTIDKFYRYSLANIWSDDRIVAITPFLLNAQDGPFKVFSFLDQDTKPKVFAETFSALASVGAPLISENSNQDTIIISPSSAPIVSLPEDSSNDATKLFKQLFSNFTTLFGFYPKK